MITISNRRCGDVGEYVGRPTPLGNPFTVEEVGRERACDLYADWFGRVVREGPAGWPACWIQLERLRQIHREGGQLVLTCWCWPRRCHAQTIKEWLERNP